MKTIKTYIAIGNSAKLNLEIKVKGQYRRIEFSNGGLAMNGNGKYQTSDEDIQKALESSKMFGVMFKLKATKNIAEPAKTTQPQNVSGTKLSGDQNPKEGGNDNAMTFASFNELRDYLMSEHNCKGSEVKTLNDALNTAEKLGIKAVIE